MDNIANEKEAFAITDDAKAEWALKKINEAQAECDKFTEFYEMQIEKIKNQTAETIGYFQGLLAAYFENVPHRSTKTGIEKYKLPSGELIRKPAGIDYQHDDAKLLLSLKSEGKDEYIQVIEKPKWAEVKKYIKETGDIPDGVTPVETPAKFEVKTGGALNAG